MATLDEARDAVLAAIVTIAPQINDLRADFSAAAARDLAEAWAWVRYPNNPHGGGAKVESS